MEFVIRPANEKDSEELLGLYASIYGDDYPLEIGTNKRVMLDALRNPREFLWLVATHSERAQIIGSAIFELDWEYQIGKVAGVVVHPSFQKKGIAKSLIDEGTRRVLEGSEGINSLYATSRTISLGPQLMFLKNGFLPLGIFPNARKIKSYETLTLFGKFRQGILQNRFQVPNIPETLEPIIKITEAVTGTLYHSPEVSTSEANLVYRENIMMDSPDEFEFIHAPQFVQKRFMEMFSSDRYSLFYPFHRPNFLIVSSVDNTELYASFSEKDHYCALITANPSITGLQDRMKKLIFALKEKGIYYLETLVRLDRFEVIKYLTEHRFIPSAIYPAMMQEEGIFYDYVLLTTTMVPLDFSELKIHHAFHPYVEQYVKEWVKTNLDIYGLSK